MSWLSWNTLSLIILLRLAASWQLYSVYFFLYYFFSRNQRAKPGSMAFRSRNFPTMYLAPGSFVFAGDAAKPHSLSYWSLQPKNNYVKELITNKIGILLNESTFSGMFSFPAKIIQWTESSGLYSWLQSSKSRFLLNPAHLLFWGLLFSDNKNYLFPVSSVNENNDVVSFISMDILFLVIAFSQIN